ncbi:DinB family protein [uncultured Chitinophaga sp.]|jgi:Uncharacterized protein conserved in bacteria|uniref:DinB family protein n=1 Tax=uncultured Chitinophaga sp. TaxID=339340 RepID=UPI0026251A76|nr:DinB family protein [uncultured Chitinophaga sp.]
MSNDLSAATLPGHAIVVTPAALLQHWQGHRGLTRRLIEAFPENELFQFSVGGMRPFSEMALELITIAPAGMQGLATGSWQHMGELFAPGDSAKPTTKAELLQLWDQVTEQINTLWPQVAPERWQEIDLAFGMYEGPMYSQVFYWVDNEIHHRGQGYVYLRALGIEPPPFWDRH